MGRDYRNYYGLPVSILAEDRDFVLTEAGIVRDDALIDVGSGRELGLKFLYDSPYFEGIVFHHGEPQAVVTCVLNKGGLIEGLRTDDPERIQRVFDVRVPE